VQRGFSRVPWRRSTIWTTAESASPTQASNYLLRREGGTRDYTLWYLPSIAHSVCVFGQKFCNATHVRGAGQNQSALTAQYS
jgi:hypothetical protein